jgi:hypothetical protein
MSKPLPDIDELRELLDYDPESGALTWRVARNRGRCRAQPGDLAGGIQPIGYRQVCVSRHRVYAHRIAWAFTYGAWPTEIDHINGIRDDNRIANLREVTRSENNRNMKLNQRSTTGVTGVCRHNQRGKPYKAYGKAHGKRQNLGCFDTLEEAAAARAAFDLEHGYHPNHGKRDEDRAAFDPVNMKREA